MFVFQRLFGDVFFAVNIFFVYACDPCQIYCTQVHKLGDHLRPDVLGEKFSFCKTNRITPRLTRTFGEWVSLDNLIFWMVSS